MTIKELTEVIMHQAKEKGFGIHPEDINVAEKIALRKLGKTHGKH